MNNEYQVIYNGKVVYASTDYTEAENYKDEMQHALKAHKRNNEELYIRQITGEVHSVKVTNLKMVLTAAITLIAALIVMYILK